MLLFVCGCTCDTVDAAVVTAVIHSLHRVVCVKVTAPAAEFRWAFRRIAMERGSQNTLAIPLNTQATTLHSSVSTRLHHCGLKPTPNH